MVWRHHLGIDGQPLGHHRLLSTNEIGGQSVYTVCHLVRVMERKRLGLMSDPSAIGSAVQALLLMNPSRRFILTREGEDMVIQTED